MQLHSSIYSGCWSISGLKQNRQAVGDPLCCDKPGRIVRRLICEKREGNRKLSSRSLNLLLETGESF